MDGAAWSSPLSVSALALSASSYSSGSLAGCVHELPDSAAGCAQDGRLRGRSCGCGWRPRRRLGAGLAARAGTRSRPGTPPTGRPASRRRRPLVRARSRRRRWFGSGWVQEGVGCHILRTSAAAASRSLCCPELCESVTTWIPDSVRGGWWPQRFAVSIPEVRSPGDVHYPMTGCPHDVTTRSVARPPHHRCATRVQACAPTGQPATKPAS